MARDIEWGKHTERSIQSDGRIRVKTTKYAAGKAIGVLEEYEEVIVKHDRQDVLTEFLRLASIVFNDESDEIVIKLKKGTVDKPFYVTARYDF
jgi:hypothetical protein